MIEKYKYISSYYGVKPVLKMEKPGQIILRSLLKDIINIPEIVFTASELCTDGINLQRINATIKHIRKGTGQLFWKQKILLRSMFIFLS